MHQQLAVWQVYVRCNLVQARYMPLWSGRWLKPTSYPIQNFKSDYAVTTDDLRKYKRHYGSAAHPGYQALCIPKQALRAAFAKQSHSIVNTVHSMQGCLHQTSAQPSAAHTLAWHCSLHKHFEWQRQHMKHKSSTHVHARVTTDPKTNVHQQQEYICCTW